MTTRALTTRLPDVRRPWFMVAVLTLLYALLVVAVQGSPLALVTVGTDFSVEAYNSSAEGYDGQFAYFIARDLFATDPVSPAAIMTRGGDLPAYRYQRILLPALGWLLAFGGQDALVPWALLLVNVVALAGGTYAMQQMLHDLRVSPWYALGFSLSLAGLAAARLAVTEPLAYGLAAIALLLAHRRRWLLAATVFALAGLAKETTLIMAAGVGLFLVHQTYQAWRSPDPVGTRRAVSGRDVSLQITPVILFGIITLLPFIIWQLILRATFGAFGVGSGGGMATSFEIIPFSGVIQILTVGGGQVFFILMLILVPFVLLPTAWAFMRVWHDLRGGQVTLLTGVLFTTALIMPFVPFSTYREPLGILRFIAGLQIAVILVAAERRVGRPLRYSLLWALTSLLVISSDFVI